MKKVLFTLSTLLAIGGSIALADAIAPNAVIISGDQAKVLNAKIAQITGKVPSEFRGKKYLSANAEVSCSEFSDGTVSCAVAIQK